MPSSLSKTRSAGFEGLGSKEAAAKTMQEVTGPVIATTLVLLAVFVPVADARHYRENV